ncbi:MAG: MMPL family transporter [Mycobacterium sp.]
MARRLIPIVVWLVLAVILNVLEPVHLDAPVSETRPMISATDEAETARINKAFPGFGTDNSVALVLDDLAVPDVDVRSYLSTVQDRLSGDPAVRSVLDMSADSLTAPVTRSGDGRVTYLPMWLSGDLGSSEGMTSLKSAQTTVERVPRPAALGLSWSGPAAEAQVRQESAARTAGWLTLAMLVVGMLLTLLVLRSRRATLAAVLSAVVALAIVFPIRGFFPALGASTPGATALAVAMTFGAAIASVQMWLSSRRNQRRPVVAVLGAAAVAAATLAVFGGWALPAADTGTISAAAGILLAALIVATTAPGYDLGRTHWLYSRFAAVAALRLRKEIYRRPQQALAFGAAILVACGFQLVGLQPSAAESTTAQRTGGFSAERMSPETVVITARRDLRNPVGLLAVNEVTRQLMAVPGVRQVQSASWPGGAPWPDATVAHQIGEFNRQVQSGGLSASPLTAAVGGLPALMSRMITSVDRIEGVVDASVDGLSSVNGSLEGMHTSIAGLTQTTEELSRHADPVRRWTGKYANCAGDPLCSIGLKITDPVDAVVADAATLTATSSEVTETANATTAVVGGSRQAIMQLRATIADVADVVNTLSSTVTDGVPEMTRSTSFINLMTDDLSVGDGGGFYLSQDRIDAESYAHVRDTLFSAEGTATRLFVFTDAERAGVSDPDLALGIKSAVGQATRYGALTDSEIEVVGPRTTASELRTQWSSDLWRATVIAALTVALVTALSLRSVQAGLSVAAASALSFVGGLALLALTLRLLDSTMHWTVPALGGGIGMAVVALDAFGVAVRARNRLRGNGPQLAFRPGGTALVCAALMWSAAIAAATLVQPSAVSVQVGALVALTVGGGYLLTRVGFISAQSTARARMIGMRAALSAGGREPMRVRPSATTP